MSIVMGPVIIVPKWAPCCARCAIRALQISFLLGRQAMLGQEAPSPPPPPRHVPSQQLAGFSTAKDENFQPFWLRHEHLHARVGVALPPDTQGKGARKTTSSLALILPSRPMTLLQA